MQETPLLHIENISKSFYGVTVLSNIDLSLHKGEGHCLAGENGSGKSTLIKIISGTYTPDAGGKLLFKGEHIKKMTPNIAQQLGIQVIFQDLALFPNLTVAQNIAINEYIDRGLSWIVPKKAKEIAQDVTERLKISLPLNEKVENLSMANRQIVAIARSLTKPASILFMDEPTASLTHQEARILLAIINQLKQKGICVLFVSHRLDELMSVADNVTVLRNGKKVITEKARNTNSRNIAEYMTGKKLYSEVRRRDIVHNQIIFSAKNLTRHHQYKDVSFTLHKGEVLGIIGLLGSGRTELALSLFGMNKPDSGTMMLQGKAFNPKNNRDAISCGLTYLSEDRRNLGLVLEQSIYGNLTLPLLPKLTNKLGFLQEASMQSYADTWLEKLQVKYNFNKSNINTLSGGNQQKVAIAKWLATDPKVVVLDSPTVGVDVGARDNIYKIIDEYAKAGLSIIVISDEVPEIYYNCDRILHMHQGQIIGEYTANALSEQDLLEKIDGIKESAYINA